MGCGQKEPEVIQAVDLRYRCEREYNLSATNAKPFTIVVTSSAPWTVTSAHPDWCIISDEEGEASPADAVHVGQGNKTNIRVQYYDNLDLDDRTDQITIQSDYWVGKVITVNQKGTAYLTVPEAAEEQLVKKAGGELVFHVESNQNWSAEVTDGSWLSVTDGATGTGDGIVTLAAEENSSELRYAEVTVFDRNKVAMVIVHYTQDGVQLVPDANEIRAGYDQISVTVGITANAKWQVVKGADAADWFTIDTPTGEGNGTIKLTLTRNEGTAIRTSSILVRNVSTNPDDPVIEKVIEIKQAYMILPVRFYVTNDEVSNWKSDWTNTPVYLDGVGMNFVAKARLNRSMSFGSYTFRWSNYKFNGDGKGPYIRHWFCFTEGAEIKVVARPGDNKVTFDFNAAGDGNKPSISEFTGADFTQPIEITYKFDPSGTKYCKVTFLVNGVEAGSFESGDNLMRSVLWGASINMYIGVGDSDGKDIGASAVCEWYEYTEPLEWGDE